MRHARPAWSDAPSTVVSSLSEADRGSQVLIFIPQQNRPCRACDNMAFHGDYVRGTMSPSLIIGCDLNRGLASRGQPGLRTCRFGPNLSIADNTSNWITFEWPTTETIVG